jgi:hypothetical protein
LWFEAVASPHQSPESYMMSLQELQSAHIEVNTVYGQELNLENLILTMKLTPQKG